MSLYFPTFGMCVAVAFLATSITRAHESPEHSIKELTAHIDSEYTPGNLFQRAIAYRALGQLDKATADLRSAITLSPQDITYQLELSRTQLASANPGAALQSANSALKLAKSPNLRAACHMLRAEAYHRAGQFKPSLQACQLAFRAIPKGEIEWFMLRSENQRQLGRHKARINDLKAGHALHHSAVLKSHWVDAIIDSSDYKTALPIIENELVDRRWKSSWLIKRSRTLIGLNRTTDANIDLHSALAEIKSRLNPNRPDPLLLADQGMAYALLGNQDEVRICLENLQKINAATWITARLEALIAKK